MSEKPPVLTNHRYVDKNIHETIERVQNYEIHQKKLFKIKEDLEKKRLKKINADQSYEHLKSQMIKKINEIKRSNQILLEKLLDISKGKRCEVKQENLQLTLPQQKSLNYQVKKKEAERIDTENQKIMERIVNQNPSLSSKKMHQDYQETKKYKKLKEQKKVLNVEKIIEKKKKMVMEARSTILPLLQTKQNSPGGPLTDMTGRNFHLNPIESQSQRMSANNIQNQDDNDGINIANTQTDYNKTGQTRYPYLNRNLNQSSNITPTSNRQNRHQARSEMAEYRDSKNSNGSQTAIKKPSKVVLEAIKNPTIKSNTINMNNSLNFKQNKPPVVPLISNQAKPIPRSDAYNSLNNTVKISKTKVNDIIGGNEANKTYESRPTEQIVEVVQDQVQSDEDQVQPEQTLGRNDGYAIPMDDSASSTLKKSIKSVPKDVDEVREHVIEDEAQFQSQPEPEQKESLTKQQTVKSQKKSELNESRHVKEDVLSDQYEEDFIGQSKQNTLRQVETQRQQTQKELSQLNTNRKGDESSLIQDSFLKDDTKFEERNSIVSGTGEEEAEEEDEEDRMEREMDRVADEFAQKQRELEQAMDADDGDDEEEEVPQEEKAKEGQEEEYDEVFDEDDQ
ncbi:UNKNOWN [Stylonychia lemnae]|uniref:Uncharacterized protein n=1 Tax=Stylonychia lemnae TaxID=5949 RepID=A0A078A3Y7_STYLE|nr:UNKNOWN [Stylonychia lemnae]|eukprot:CDW76589.1 UNKNOWN [Stylonychia lemnae]